MRRPFLIAFVLVVAVLPIAVGLMSPPVEGNYPRVVTERAGHSPLITADPRDAAINRAIAKAVSELDAFIAVLRNPTPWQSGFAIKVRLHSETVDEHVWLDPVEWRDDKFVGELANSPVDFPQYREGQILTVDRSEVTDWEYRDRGQLIGAYTKRVLAGDVSPQQAAEWGLRSSPADTSPPVP